MKRKCSVIYFSLYKMTVYIFLIYLVIDIRKQFLYLNKHYLLYNLYIYLMQKYIFNTIILRKKEITLRETEEKSI